MRAMWVWATALVTACSGSMEPPSEGAWEADAVDAEGLESGARATIRVSSVVPGRRVWMVFSGVTRGTSLGFRLSGELLQGPCTVFLLGNCVQAGNPGVNVVGSMPGTGSLTLRTGVYGGAAPSQGESVWIQAAARSKLGQPLGALAPVERIVGCGDAVVGRGEVCDDGGVLNGDGCDELCQCEADRDGDDICDADDGCPSDALKNDPGTCGCDFDEPAPGAACAVCPRDALEDCDGGCVDPSTVGNGTCDANLDCAAAGFDAGDCNVPPVPQRLVAASGEGGGRLKLYRADLGAALDLYPYGESWTGGVRVAAGDLNGDGVDDLITGAGPGAAPHVKVFDGATGAELRSFFAYSALFTGGVFVAAGDLDGDGVADIITGAGAGSSGGHVKVFDGVSGVEVGSFFAYDGGFTGGVHVAAGDVDGDGAVDIITGAGAGAAPHVKVFNGTSGLLISSFFPFEPSFAGGVHVAAGDVNGDGVADLITGAGAGSVGGPVKVYSEAGSTLLTSFLGLGGSVTHGVRVGAGDLNGDGRAEILVAAGPGGTTQVTAIDYQTGASSVSVFLDAIEVESGAWVCSATP